MQTAVKLLLLLLSVNALAQDDIRVVRYNMAFTNYTYLLDSFYAGEGVFCIEATNSVGKRCGGLILRNWTGTTNGQDYFNADLHMLSYQHDLLQNKNVPAALTAQQKAQITNLAKRFTLVSVVKTNTIVTKHPIEAQIGP